MKRKSCMKPQNARWLRQEYPYRNGEPTTHNFEEIFDRKEPHILTEGRKFEMPRKTTILGKNWDMNIDRLGYARESPLSCLAKRKQMKILVLRVASLVFDLLVLVAPYVVRTKMLIQKLPIWRVEDERLPYKLKKECQAWTMNLAKLCPLKITRRVISLPSDGLNTIELTIFCGASVQNLRLSTDVDRNKLNDAELVILDRTSSAWSVSSRSEITRRWTKTWLQFSTVGIARVSWW